MRAVLDFHRRQNGGKNGGVCTGGRKEGGEEDVRFIRTTDIGEDRGGAL